MGFHGPGPGRPKGSKDKYTKLRDTFFAAVDELGGKKWLKEQAQKEPVAFMKIIAGLIPKDDKLALSGSVTLNVVTGINRAPNDTDGISAEDTPEADS